MLPSNSIMMPTTPRNLHIQIDIVAGCTTRTCRGHPRVGARQRPLGHARGRGTLAWRQAPGGRFVDVSASYFTGWRPQTRCTRRGAQVRLHPRPYVKLCRSGAASRTPRGPRCAGKPPPRISTSHHDRCRAAASGGCCSRNKKVEEDRKVSINVPEHKKYCDNYITTAKYSLLSFVPRSLFEQ